MKSFLVLLISLFVNLARGQFAPEAGVAGSTAMYKDSAVFVGWATGANINRGYKDLAVPDSGYAISGDSLSALGAAGDGKFVSLGDKGYAVLTFAAPIYNDTGFDFAVFENSFDGHFLELAFVEVSSDGLNFYRFPSTSNSDTAIQTGPFAYTDPRKINNLAGKYKANYGTPFDLEELKGTSGLDVERVTHVKIIDVCGSVNPLFGSRDHLGNLISDPYPTNFASGGFDLDAVGVIHLRASGFEEVHPELLVVYPNPAKRGALLTFTAKEKMEIEILDLSGKLLYNCTSCNFLEIPETMPAGIYLIRSNSPKGISNQKVVITE